MALMRSEYFAHKALEYIRQDRSAEFSQLLQTVESSGLLSEEIEHRYNLDGWLSVGVSQINVFSPSKTLFVELITLT